VGQAARDARAQVERAREQLADDIQSLANQANLPRRLRRRKDAQLQAARRRFDPQLRRAQLREAVWEIRSGDRSLGVRKLAAAAREPMLAAAALAAVGAAAARRSSGAGHAAVPSLRRPGVRAGDVAGLVSRPLFGAAMHHRQARRAGKAPGAGQFLAYTAVGAVTTVATKWANDRIDRTAPPA
jgi:hypothetical protein